MEDPRRVFDYILLQNAIIIIVALAAFWTAVTVSRLAGARNGYSLAALGLRRPAGGVSRGVFMGLAVGVGLWFLSLPSLQLTALILRRFGYEAQNNAQKAIFEAIGRWVEQGGISAVLLTGFALAVVTPVAEELFNRGALFGGLRWAWDRVLDRIHKGGKDRKGIRRLGTACAALASSAFFAAMHFSPVLLPTLFVFALVLCWLYAKTASLLPSIAAHAAFNLCTTTVVVLGTVGS